MSTTTHASPRPRVPASRQIGTFILLLLAMVVEGYDLMAANFVAPVLLSEWELSRVAIGPFLSASLVGMLIGTLFVAPLGDRFGRKRIIVASCAGYGVASLAAVPSNSLELLVGLRFLIGLGLGSTLPNILALGTELALRRKASTPAFLGIGMMIGASGAGLVAAWLLPEFGWRSLFFVGGIAPLLIALALQRRLPPDRRDERAEVAGRQVPAADTAGILRGGMAQITVPLWMIFAAVLFTVYLMSAWVPLIATDAGFDIRDASLVGAGYHIGGIGGGLLASILIQRFGWSLIVVLLLGTAAVLALIASGWSGASTLAVLLVVTGALVNGTQNAINGAAGVTYPLRIRARGIGWALGIGRTGSIFGPLAASVAIWFGLSQSYEITALALA